MDEPASVSSKVEGLTRRIYHLGAFHSRLQKAQLGRRTQEERPFGARTHSTQNMGTRKIAGKSL
eukprot:1925393-Pyramimonas_sp.AAC.1